MKLGRLPFLALAMLGLATGVWSGLARLGWGFAGGAAGLSALHGPLMVCAFFGALIGIERAVAHGGRWAFIAPLLAGASGVAGVAGAARAAPLLATLSALAFAAVSLLLARRHVADFSVALVLAALSWLVGNGLWLFGASLSRVLPWWAAFLVLTILAERRELGRVLSPPRVAGWAFGASGLLILAAVASSLSDAIDFRRPLAAAFALATLWLAAFDVARFTVRRTGLTRFIAVNLLWGYAWLGATALLLATTPPAPAGPHYDAVTHALFVGFVFSMVFAHAPIVFPAILGVPLHYRPSFYAHVALLHLSLAARIGGDLGAHAGLRAWGGLGNAAALALFFVLTLRSIIAGRPTPAKVGVP